jgi:hypothetical protein
MALIHDTVGDLSEGEELSKRRIKKKMGIRVCIHGVENLLPGLSFVTSPPWP